MRYVQTSGENLELTPEALTMFLKWALSVPVVWWYSMTQLLLRISPLLSLWQRADHLYALSE